MEGDQRDANVVGTCEGPNSVFIKLISRNGHEFFIGRKFAVLSGTIKAMLSDPERVQEGEADVIHLNEISDRVLSVICMFLHFKAKFNSDPTVPQRTPNLVNDFPLDEEIASEVIAAATFLDC